MSPINVVWRAPRRKATQEVRPMKGMIAKPSTVTCKSLRGTDILNTSSSIVPVSPTRVSSVVRSIIIPPRTLPFLLGFDRPNQTSYCINEPQALALSWPYLRANQQPANCGKERKKSGSCGDTPKWQRKEQSKTCSNAQPGNDRPGKTLFLIQLQRGKVGCRVPDQRAR